MPPMEHQDNTAGRILRYFALETNIEGINNAGRSRSLVRAATWLGLFVIFLALTVSDMTDLIQVTVCNKNKVSCRRLGLLLQQCHTVSQCKHPVELQRLHQLGRCNVSQELKPSLNSSEQSSDSHLSVLSLTAGPAVVSKTEIISDILDSFHNLNQSAVFRADQEFLLTFLQLSREEQFLIGHQFTDMVKACTFRGVDCLAMLGSEEFKTKFLDHEVHLSATHGNCFTLQTVSKALGKSSLTGATYGLSLVVKLEQADYLRGGQTLAAGLRVTVQEREAPPLIDEYGLDIAANTLTSLALQLVNITRHTYTGCHPAPSHSINNCQKLCIQQSVRDNCGCYHPLYQTEGAHVLLPCDLVSGSRDEECVLELIVKYDTGMLECSCLPACTEKDYEKLVSSTVWPAASAATAISNMYGVDITDRKQADYLKLDVYLMSLNVKSITETARYTTASFISTLGGSLGAWLGFSVCMIFEVVELAIDLIIHSLFSH